MIRTTSTSPIQRWLVRSTFLAFGLAVVVGCGTKPANDPVLNPQHRLEFDIADPGTASLKGTITHAGQPIVAGRMCFFVKNALVPMSGTINNDGTFHAIGLPEGTLHVALILDPSGEMPFPTPPKGAGMPQLPGMGPPAMPGPPKAGGMPPGPGGAGPGGPGAGGPPGMPPPMSGPANAPMVGLPLKFPPHLLGQLTNFDVPPQKKADYAKLHKSYSAFGAKNKLTVTIKPGENVVDLVVP